MSADLEREDQLRLECGVFGVFDVPDAAAITALGLHALQHRGQEACGIAVFDGTGFHTERHMGHVGEAFTGQDLVERLPGASAIGHTRYSTSGGSFARNIQPMFADEDPAPTEQSLRHRLRQAELWLV